MKEKALRDTQIRSMHEMVELKRAQELRVDEVFVRKLSENRGTIQELTSQIQDLQEMVHCMNGSGIFENMESSKWKNFSRSQSTQQSFQVHALC